MGSHARPSRTTRIARRLPIAAAPALVGVAAAFAATNTPTGPSAALAPAHQTPAQQTTANAAATPSGLTAARLVSFSRPVVERSFGAQPAAARTATARTAAAPETKYTVKAGDTLSSIAKRVYHNPRYWPVLYQANHQEIQYASAITAGQVLTVPAKPAKIPAAPAAQSSASAQTSAAPAAPAATTPVAEVSSTVSTAGDSSFQACVIARESGGNSQVMNASGHYAQTDVVAAW